MDYSLKTDLTLYIKYCDTATIASDASDQVNHELVVVGIDPASSLHSGCGSLHRSDETHLSSSNTTGLAQGLLDGEITPSSCMFLSCLATSCLTTKGILLGGCLIGVASPVSIPNCSKSVSLHSPGSSENASCCSAKSS